MVADNYWLAKQGLEALKIEWSMGPNADLTTAKLRAALAASWRAASPSSVANQEHVPPAESSRRPTIHPCWLMPPWSRSIQPSMSRAKACEIWVGTQVPARAVAAAARITGHPEKQVVLHNQYLGGGFGRRLETDSVEQAVMFAAQVPYPLKVLWSREEDIRQDVVRPMYHDQVSAIVDGGG